MSTRALYTFKGETTEDNWNVYKHSDGYPTGAANVLKTALDFFAWQLPRYESDEFAAAFCAAAKSSWLWGSKFNEEDFKDHSPNGKYRAYSGGNARLMPQGDPLTVAAQNCADIQYRYEIYQGNNQKLRVRAYSVDAWEKSKASEELLFDCLIADFPKQAKEL